MTKEERIKEEWKKEKGLEWYENNFEFINFDNGYFQNRDEYFRIDSLQGIENNNGWVKIESEDDLPSETECYHVFSKENEYLIGTFHTENKGMIEYWLQNFTHYQPIVKPEPPLY